MKKIFVFCLFIVIAPCSVSSSQTPQRFIDNGNGTVTDKVKKLMWMKDPNFLGNHCRENNGDYACRLLFYSDMPFLQWDKAQMAVKLISYAGYDDWRLPSREEIKVLNRISREELKNPFGDMLQMYWSSSPGKKMNTAWMIFPPKGLLVSIKKKTFGFIWPVRDDNENHR